MTKRKKGNTNRQADPNLDTIENKPHWICNHLQDTTGLFHSIRLSSTRSLQESDDILGLGDCDCRLITLSAATLLGDEALGLSANSRDRRFFAEDGDGTRRGAGPLSGASSNTSAAADDADGLAHRALAFTDLVCCM